MVVLQARVSLFRMPAVVSSRSKDDVVNNSLLLYSTHCSSLASRMFFFSKGFQVIKKHEFLRWATISYDLLIPTESQVMMSKLLLYECVKKRKKLGIHV